jgi:hypothetical protein
VVSWGTPQGKATVEVTQWPRGYRERNERQEHSCKRLIDHGALNTNDGRKKIVGPDRHQPRAREQLDQAVQAAQQRLGTQAEALKVQQDQGAESVSKGHGKRLAQRQRAWVSLAQERQDAQETHDQRVAQAQAWGSPRQRADRDFRKQTIMTVRPLLRENALTSFMAVLVGTLTVKVSRDCIVPILFERSGARMVTGSQTIDWLHTTGLSAAYQRLLTAVVDGLCAMDLRVQGKPIHVRLKGLSP